MKLKGAQERQDNWLQQLREIRKRTKISQTQLARVLGTSLVAVNRWERRAGTPSPAQSERIAALHNSLTNPDSIDPTNSNQIGFSSYGIRSRIRGQALLGQPLYVAHLTENVDPPILTRLMSNQFFHHSGEASIADMLIFHAQPAETTNQAFSGTISAGKNTYTYDAHTYHTKVPPQGIAEVIRHYLPHGGLILDPFAGSGMTGVAARVVGANCILNELSPAACFIANRFSSSSVPPAELEGAVHALLQEVAPLRKKLYSTSCRECGRETELLYTVWSYRVVCNRCKHEFQLWDHCRSYGRVVREHKILTEFPCPGCREQIKKSRLTRTIAEPVMIGYKCCGSKQQEVTHPPNAADVKLICSIEANPPLQEGFFPNVPVPDGVNLRQPKKHGLDWIHKFYTPRNLAALSHLWRAIHRLQPSELAAQVAFVFTSLYQRVTRLSEFRFWGGSGNTAHFNVPFIFDESNVFVSFERKARTIQDHLEATATLYKGNVVVVNNSATALRYLPDNSVDLVFTDPPFGANINYSEMNILWESWLGRFTDNTEEAIVNRVQGKDTTAYQGLMTKSLRECYRVLRPEHWLILVFMNSSGEIWESLRNSIQATGFEIVRMDSFDKQHGTFKQFVSENTAGMDLVLHCRKPLRPFEPRATGACADIVTFLKSKSNGMPTNAYLHVGRNEEIDFRTLYSEWLAQAFRTSSGLVDFAAFRAVAQQVLSGESQP